LASVNLDNQTLLENLEVSLILIDSEAIIQRVNISAETLFEQSRRYLIGMPLSELIDDTEVSRCVKEVLESNAQFTLRELQVAASGRELLVDMTLTQVSSGHGEARMVLIEMHSINRISRFIKEQNQLERQQSFRLMMRGLAHEIKNPLGGIRGAAQLLHREIQDHDRRELTDILIKEADRLTRLVDRVMGSREQLKLAPLNIHEVLEHVIGIVTAHSETRVAIERVYDPTLPEITADREQLIQAVLNIVVNALDIQRESTQPKIGFVTQFERYVTLNQQLHKRALKLTIWDAGPGVDPELREILFDPLITSRPDGSGLGLSITQEIIQRHEGVVQLEDCDPHTCFSIYLPYLTTSERNSQPDKSETVEEML
jgi:two-component system nitrogen regulation sensor histidine kinase GlnL